MAMAIRKEGVRWPWWRWGLTGLSGLGLVLSAYLSWHYLMGGTVIGCSGGGPCEQVLGSRWSAVAGVLPISGLAAGAYLAMLMGSFFIGPETAPADRRLAWGAMLVLSGAAAGSAVWFIYLQRWVIGAFCPYCMATHVTGILLAVLILLRAPRQAEKESGADGGTDGAAQRAMGAWPAMGLLAGGMAMAGILAVTQVVLAPPVAYQAGAAQQAKLPAIDAHTSPLVGSPDAAYVVTLLFDYKCPHCQKLHAMLEDVESAYGGKVAFVLCPAPLNSRCNPYIAREVEEFKDSCELARIGMAVWVAKREAFGAFDKWMFTPEPEHLWHPKTLEAALAKAAELVGQAAFDKALQDPWVNQYMQVSVRLYGQTVGMGDSGSAVPKLVFGRRWVTPQPESAADLIKVLQENLGVPKP